MIEKQFLDINKYTRRGILRKYTEAIVMHYTMVPEATAQNQRDSFNRKHVMKYRSAHFIVDWTGAIIQLMPEMEKAYHCGSWKYKSGITEKLGSDPNMTTIGIEMCHKKASGEFSKITIQYAILLVAYLCKRFDLHPTTQILRHYDITGKLCPLWWIDHPDNFDKFQIIVKEHLINRRWLR